MTEHTLELQRRIAMYDDEPAYKEIFFSFHGPLVRFAFTFLEDRDASQEVVSDVFVKVWERRKTLTSIDNLKLYLYISVKNSALNHLAKIKKQPLLSLDDLNIDIPTPYLNPEQLLVNAELMKRVHSAINSLPPRCKLVYRLVKEDGLRYREVSEILNISIKTIDNQLAIALRKIGKAIDLKLKAGAMY